MFLEIPFWNKFILTITTFKRLHTEMLPNMNFEIGPMVVFLFAELAAESELILMGWLYMVT